MAIISNAAAKAVGAEIVFEDGWSIYIPGAPIAATGATLDEAVSEMLLALREYAADWRDRLQSAPNHVGHQALVQLVERSSDGGLEALLLAQGECHLERGDRRTGCN